MCGSKRVARKTVEVKTKRRKPVFVEADVCPDCGEQYYDLEAMRVIQNQPIMDR